jgi:phosphoribosylformimino-5-aminoimidazole carboxamide ribotide isomerase
MRPLTLYPAIDLKGGRCVRLRHGDMAQATVYHDDPAAQARVFADAGFDWLHIVDLDGAFAGATANASAINAILESTSAKTQLGGGIRTLEAIDAWLDRGVARVILGTIAVTTPTLARDACKRHPGRIVIGVDARDGRVKTEGWSGDSDHSAVEIVRRFEDFGAAAAIYTDIGRDGALTGVNVEATAALAAAVRIPLIASGGVADLDDISRLRRAEASIEGVIIGKALYDGRFSPSDALKAARVPGKL